MNEAIYNHIDNRRVCYIQIFFFLILIKNKYRSLARSLYTQYA